MRRLTCIFALICLWGCAHTPLSVKDLKSAKQIYYVPATPSSWTLSNGMQVFFLQDQELPTVSASLYLRGGTLIEDPASFGAIAAMGSLMREGGAGDLAAQDLDSELDKYSISIGSSFGEEFGQVSLGCLSADLERGFAHFADVVLRPRFEATRLALWKDRARDKLRRRRDDPQTVVGYGFDQLIYPNSNFGRFVVEADLAHINLERIHSAYQRMLKPDGAVLVLSGNLTEERARDLSQQFFGSWSKRGSVLPAFEPPGPAAPPAIYFVEMPLEQSTVILGQRGVPRFTSDHAAIDVFNQLLSGGFGSRLVAEVRERLGLSYSVFGQIIPYVVDGKNLIFLQTQSTKTAEAIQASIGVLKNLQQQPVAKDELDNARRAIENSYIFGFEQPGQIASRAATLLIYGYPEDYDRTYLSKIRAVSAEDVRQVAGSRWDLSKFVMIVVGNQSAYNSLAQAQNDSKSDLKGFALKRVKFDQQLIF